ncbi:hypothetical protein NQ314_014968 [Rhamnusium bicolor]|uniref:CCHC-type domain-containing protein n=1 Tax=Rhamnusium bicolor TaxID=1586634 RepID=A0AAV8X076_9CUCU|nr:hypothetical protein NQ314_014968 [Rhamnusium bicolor]
MINSMTTTATTSTNSIVTTMAQSISVPVSPPHKFDFSAPAAWPQWRKRFERFMSVSGQNIKSDEEKINILMYILGEEAEEVMLQFTQVPTTYVETLTALENHFIPRRNTIFERYKFNTRTQQPGESIESFITSLHSLAEHCLYGALKEELIRDRIVVGMLDQKTSERLQLQTNLTLSECILAVKQAELQASQNKEIQSMMPNRGSGVFLTEAMHARGKSEVKSAVSTGSIPRPSWFQGERSVQQRRNSDKNVQNKCLFCGLAVHPREECPASRSTCRVCRKPGHWATVCRSNKNIKVRSIHVDNKFENTNSCANCNNNEPNDNFLGLMQINHISEKEWIIPLKILELHKQINFMIDSGADITCIPIKSLDVNIIQNLVQTDRLITGPSGKALKVVGILHATLCNFNKIVKTDIYVIEELCKPILGRSAIKSLDLLQFGEGFVSQVNAVTFSFNEIQKSFPNLFDDIGMFKTEMDIKILENVQPFVQSVPRVVPIPLLKPLKEELERLQKLDIIESVEYPTPWVSPIVLVRKKDKIRLCVDYTRLNKPIEPHHWRMGSAPRNYFLIIKSAQVFRCSQKILNQNVDTKPLFKGEGRYRNKMSRNYNQRHRVRPLSDLNVNDGVWVIDLKMYGRILQKLNEPRSFLVETNSGTFRRNRWHLVPAKYYSFVSNNFDFQSTNSQVTPAPSNNTNTNLYSSSNGPNVSDNHNLASDNNLVNSRVSSDTGDQNTSLKHSDIVSQESVESASDWSRPVRNTKRPTYLQDYITY